MATVRGALALYDGMTQPLHHIHNALVTVINSFEAMQAASGNAVDISAIQSAREELARGEVTLDEIEKNIRDADRAQQDFNDKIKKGSNAADGLANKFGKLKGAIAALGIGAGIKKLVGLSDSVTSTTARLSLIADDGGSIENIEQQLNNLNQTSTVSVNATDGGTIAALTDEMSALDQERIATVTATDNGSLDRVSSQLDSLNRSATATVTVNATDDGTVGVLKNQFQELSEAAADRQAVFTVSATDNGTISMLDQRVQNIPDEKSIMFSAIDNGSVSDIEQQVQNVENHRGIVFNATDNGTIAALNGQISNLPAESGMVFTATDRGTIGGIEEQVQSVENYKGVFFDATDNGTISAINRQIGNVDQEAAVTIKTEGGDRITELDQQANELNQQALVTVNATDNGSVAALNTQIDDLNREANVAVDVTANVTDNNSVKILEQKIMASAQRSRAAYLDTAAAIASMGANARSAFATNDELIAFMEQINKQFVIGGASAQGQAAAMLQLTQAMGAGALRGEELNSILENAPGIARAIEQYMGVAEGSIKQYAEQGMITADVVKNAMFAAADETNAKFESMPMTWAQIWTSMQNRGIQALDPILTKINAIANSDRMQGFVDGMMDAFGVAVGILGIILDLVSSVGGAIYDNWSWIAPLIYGIATAFTVYYGALAIYNGIQAISTALTAAHAFAEKVKAASTAMATGATFAETVAQQGLNAALMACPIMWIVLLVIALIAVFYAAVEAVNHFAGTSVSATGIICGVFMAALAFIGNLFVALWNVAVDVFTLIYNLVATVANFIGNVFNDPVSAVVHLFFDLADTVLGVLQTLAGALDAVFGSDLAGAVQGWRDSLSGWVDDTFGEQTEVMAKLNADDMKLDHFEYGAAFDAGYNFGEGIENKIGDIFKTPDLDQMGFDSLGTYDMGNQFDGIAANTGDTAANTAATADALDYAEEDLQYMRDIAEREAINRYTTAEIKVEQHNENHISSEMDLDGVMDAMTYQFAERLDISTEGVHP